MSDDEYTSEPNGSIKSGALSPVWQVSNPGIENAAECENLPAVLFDYYLPNCSTYAIHQLS